MNITPQSHPILDRRPFFLKLGLGDPSQGLYVSPEGKGLLFLQIGHPAPGSRMFRPAGSSSSDGNSRGGEKAAREHMLLLPISESQMMKMQKVFYLSYQKLETRNSQLCKLLLFLGMCSFVYDRCSLALSMGIVHWQSGDT